MTATIEISICSGGTVSNNQWDDIIKWGEGWLFQHTFKSFD